METHISLNETVIPGNRSPLSALAPPVPVAPTLAEVAGWNFNGIVPVPPEITGTAPGITIDWRFVTPDIAARLLRANQGNRSLSPKNEAKLVRDLTRGHYLPNPHQVIGIFDSGILSNGQHTLNAIVKSGVGAWLLVATGIPQRVALNIDTGRPRSILDNLRISGSQARITAEIAAMLRFMAWRDDAPPSSTDIEELSEAYAEVVAFVMNNRKPRRRVTTAPVLAAIGRAYMHGVDPEVLKRMLAVLHSGRVEGEVAADDAASKLRRRLEDITRPKAIDKLRSFRLTQRVIAMVAAGERVPDSLVTPPNDVYPFVNRMERS
jgi:hypothetical protein